VRPIKINPISVALGLTSAIALLLLALPQIGLVLRGIAERGWEALPNSGLVEALTLSLITTALSILVTVIFGTPLAYILVRWRFPLRGVVRVFVELPIVLPPTVAGLALLVTTGNYTLLWQLGIQIPFTTAAVVIAQTFVSAPFYIRAAQLGFQNIPREIEDAALVDGAAGASLFRQITLPLAGTALAAGLTLSWARALGEFGATIMLAASIEGRTQTMPLFIYYAFNRNIEASIWASIILLGCAFVALLLSQWLTRRAEIQV
jgi:molybdate transport system permease protein